MQVQKLGTLFSLLVAGSMIQATPPPVYAPFDEQICRASYVFIGTAQNFRVVADGRPPFCADTPPQERGTLTMCGSVEVDVQIETVIYPSDWKPAEPVVYRFGGGFFSVESLRNDLEGRRRLFHVVQVSGSDAEVFKSSQDWVLSAFSEDEVRVRAALATCKRVP